MYLNPLLQLIPH